MLGAGTDCSVPVRGGRERAKAVRAAGTARAPKRPTPPPTPRRTRWARMPSRRDGRRRSAPPAKAEAAGRVRQRAVRDPRRCHRGYGRPDGRRLTPVPPSMRSRATVRLPHRASRAPTPAAGLSSGCSAHHQPPRARPGGRPDRPALPGTSTPCGSTPGRTARRRRPSSRRPPSRSGPAPPVRAGTPLALCGGEHAGRRAHRGHQVPGRGDPERHLARPAADGQDPVSRPVARTGSWGGCVE